MGKALEKYPISNRELQVHLDEQIGNLLRSAQLFDQGYHVEARRLAVTLRVMLHSGRSPSLLKRLGQEEIELIDSSPPFDPQNLLAFHGLVSLAIAEGEVSYEPKLDNGQPVILARFADWWNATVFADRQGRKMSRRDVVLTAADQDGGAHVDGALRGDYAALRFSNSLGWMTDQNLPPNNDPGYAAIRQITHEVLKVFDRGYSRDLDEVRSMRTKSEISGGKLRFAPHEKRFWINQMAAPAAVDQFYLTEITIDSITTGSVMMIVNTAASLGVSRAGTHKIFVKAGLGQESGVFGEYTDAVIDRVSIR